MKKILTKIIDRLGYTVQKKTLRTDYVNDIRKTFPRLATILSVINIYRFK